HTTNPTRRTSKPMKKMIVEFKDFINKGDVVTVAVGLIMALTFKDVIDKFVEGVLNPLIAAVFGKPDFTEIGFDLGKSRISIGLVIDAAITFVLVAFILFLLVKAYNSWKSDDDEETGPSEIDLLTEIRDQLRKG
ncbi:MscL family protein, partial [Altererythrobacter sp.]|uniref:MscL family protein n=1 Tax=Altererythrobacter sp. TaxID=1872480 RepID=UPI003D0872A9